MANVTENITAIKSNPIKIKSSFGSWKVLADAHFSNGIREWNYHQKPYFFFSKKRALCFIEQVNKTISNGNMQNPHILITQNPLKIE